MAVKPVPDGYHTLTPTLAVENAAEAIDFYTRAFGARERGRMLAPDGRIAHAEIELGDSLIMLSDPMPGMTSKPPKDLGATSGGIFVYVEDVDAFAQRAVDAGAQITMPIENQFWGDRFGQLTDPFGHTWAVATHVEDVPEEEMAQRAEKAMAEMMGQAQA
jgi:PhnB protein